MLSSEDFCKEVGSIVYPDLPDKEINLDTPLNDDYSSWDSLAGVQLYDIIERDTGKYYENFDVLKNCETVGDLWEFYINANSD